MLEKKATPKNFVEESDELKPLTSDIVGILVANHRRFLSFLNRRLDNPAVAEELLQTAFTKAIEKAPELDHPESVVSWFYRVLKNALIDFYRHKAVEAKALARHGLEAKDNAFDSELKAEICSCMHGLLPTLKPEYAEIVRRVDLEEQSLGHVAGELGISASNATVRLHRGRQALKKQLERCCGSCATHGCLNCDCNH